MKGGMLMGAVLVTALLSFNAEASMHWVPAPPKVMKHDGHAHGGHDRNAAKPFVLAEGKGAVLTLLLPDLNHQPLLSERGVIPVKGTGLNGYHAMVAERISGKHYESAVRYIYQHGRPVDLSPSLVTSHRKMELEIEPSPLAREHWRYTSGNDMCFKLRFKGKALVGEKLVLTTANGSTLEGVTDGKGFVSFTLPEDFAGIKPGRSNNRPSEFLLTASHVDKGMHYDTTFSSAYYVNPSHWQSLQFGLATAFGGMLFGGLMTFRNLRRKEK